MRFLRQPQVRSTRHQTTLVQFQRPTTVVNGKELVYYPVRRLRVHGTMATSIKTRRRR